MLVPVTYTGPRDVLDLSWTTDGLHFERGKTTDVPAPLVPLLKELPGHGFSVLNAAGATDSVAPAPVVEIEAPAPEPIPADDPTPAESPVKPPRRKAKG